MTSDELRPFFIELVSKTPNGPNLRISRTSAMHNRAADGSHDGQGRHFRCPTPPTAGAIVGETFGRIRSGMVGGSLGLWLAIGRPMDARFTSKRVYRFE